MAVTTSCSSLLRRRSSLLVPDFAISMAGNILFSESFHGQALRCAVTVNSDVGKVTLNKHDLLLRTVGSKEALTASVAVEDGTNVPITWVSSNPGVATVDASGVVTAVADGEAKITALSPDGRFDSCSVFVGLAADKYDSEEDLADELKLPDPYVAVRMNRLS